ncbi:MAG: metal ABC transporter solute-binding protein, Zn/Mn family [Dysgonomonas sp.]
MKNSIITIIILSTAIVFSSCKPKLEKDKIIFVSIEPQKFFLDNIVKDNFSVKTIIPDGSNPESYDPTPAQMVDLGKSALYFKVVFISFENAWIPNVQKNNPKLRIVNSSARITPINADDHDHEGPDPHIWSSPKTALQMAQNMYDEVVNIDSANKSVYEANFKQLSQLIYNTDSIIKGYLEKAPSRSFIIYHPALSYFSKEYELCQYSIEHNGKQPTPSEIRNLIELAKAENIKVVFIQAEYDEKNAETIANEIGAKVVPLNLLSYNWNEEMIKIAKALAGEYE